MRRFIQACWQGSRFCARCVLSLVLWSVWLGLLVLLGVQLYVANVRELSVPRFVLQEVSSRLTASGLRIEFGRALFDPSGRLFVENARILSESLNEPLLTARSLYLRLDPWHLLLREVDLTEVHAAGVELHVPAMLSPSGRSEAVLRDLHASLRFREDDLTFDLVEAHARYGNLELTASGALTIPPARPEQLPVLDEIVRHYLRLVRQAAAFTPELDALTAPKVQLRLSPDPARIAMIDVHLLAARADFVPGRFGLSAGLGVELPEATTTLPLALGTDLPLSVDLSGQRVTSDGLLDARRLRVRVAGRVQPRPFVFTPGELLASAGHGTAKGFHAEAVTLHLQPGMERAVRTDVTGRLSGEAWALRGELDPRTFAGTVNLSGVVPRPLFVQVAERTDPRLPALVQYTEPPAVAVQLDLGEDGRPVAARGTLTTGPVVARNVALAGVRGRFDWAGERVQVDDIELLTAASVARGSYTMNTATRDFRFLLQGALRPADIDGWFREWWPRFWKNFDFPSSIPEADVDVSGRWGVPRATSVFVAASGRETGLRGVVLDELHTRMFIRPGYFDGLDFDAVQAGRSASGRFTRVQDLAAGALRTMDFSVESNLPAGDAARLAGDEVIALVDPYHFSTPPEVKVSGHIEGPAAPGGPHASLQLEGRTADPMTFHHFPLSHLVVAATIEGERVQVNDVTAGFAGGMVRGRGELTGPQEARRLGFDGVLEGAVLGEAIRTVEEFGARRAGAPLPPQSRFQERIATGRLDLAVSAEGFLSDLRSYRGSGNAAISGANLGEVNLLGILSTLLRRTLLNYSTLQLDTARANFEIDGPTLIFSEVRVTGPRAALEATGTYDFDGKSVDFATKVFPFEESRGLLGSAIGAMLAPLSTVLEVKLTGRLDNPSWSFVYGPTSLFRAIVGPETKTQTSPPDPID